MEPNLNTGRPKRREPRTRGDLYVLGRRQTLGSLHRRQDKSEADEENAKDKHKEKESLGIVGDKSGPLEVLAYVCAEDGVKACVTCVAEEDKG